MENKGIINDSKDEVLSGAFFSNPRFYYWPGDGGKTITYLYTIKAAMSSKINKMLRRPPIM